jgi:hypothetical protein
MIFLAAGRGYGFVLRPQRERKFLMLGFSKETTRAPIDSYDPRQNEL